MEKGVNFKALDQEWHGSASVLTPPGVTELAGPLVREVNVDEGFVDGVPVADWI